MTFPNQLTSIRIILSPVFLYFALQENPVSFRISFVIYIFASLTDWYDGWYARKYKSVSKTGIFLDPFADKVLTTFAFIFFYLKGIMPLWMLILIAARDLLITFLRSLDEYRGITLKTSYLSKVKTFVQMTYIFVILSLMTLLTFSDNINILPEFNDGFLLIKRDIANFIYSEWNYFLLLLITLLTVYSGIDYFYQKLRNK
jgi:CDP-diacylglycerol--glycerol-3-phosphate 3-phosphatidyltransferase